MLCGTWLGVGVGVFTWALPQSDHVAVATWSITLAVLGGVGLSMILPVPWGAPVVALAVLGVGIGGASTHWGVAVAGVVVAAALFARWWLRLAPRLTLYRNGTRTVGRVGDVSEDRSTSEDSHVTVRSAVEYVDGHGSVRVVTEKNKFESGRQPRVGDEADVYYLADEPDSAVVVFRPN